MIVIALVVYGKSKTVQAVVFILIFTISNIIIRLYDHFVTKSISDKEFIKNIIIMLNIISLVLLDAFFEPITNVILQIAIFLLRIGFILTIFCNFLAFRSIDFIFLKRFFIISGLSKFFPGSILLSIKHNLYNFRYLSLTRRSRI